MMLTDWCHIKFTFQLTPIQTTTREREKKTLCLQVGNISSKNVKWHLHFDLFSSYFAITESVIDHSEQVCQATDKCGVLLLSF